MRRDAKLNLAELAESPYAACLEDSARGTLRFPPELEAEFRSFQLESLHGLVRAFAIFAVTLQVMESLRRLLEGAPPGGAANWVVWFVLLPLSALVLAIVWSQRYDSWYRPIGRVAVAAIVLAQAATAAHMLALGRLEGAVEVPLLLMAGFLLTGALFLEGIVLAALALLAMFVGWCVTRGPVAGFWIWYGLTVAVGAVAALASYHLERTSRRHFLESGLLREMAWRDGLTGLKNRRAFDEHLSAVWSQGVRERHPLGLLLVDIDHFKAYNDACGHQQGDECLRRVGAVLEGFARRPLDMVARYGGEELVVVLYQAGAERVLEIAEDLRRSVERLRIEHPNSPASPFVTVSVGAACVRPSAERSPEGLVQLADEALYAAKHGTRNCVRFQQAEYATLSTGNFRQPRLDASLRSPAPGRAAR